MNWTRRRLATTLWARCPSLALVNLLSLLPPLLRLLRPLPSFPVPRLDLSLPHRCVVVLVFITYVWCCVQLGDHVLLFVLAGCSGC